MGRDIFLCFKQNNVSYSKFSKELKIGIKI